MKHLTPSFSKLYQTALRTCIDQGAQPEAQLIEQIGSKIRTAKVPMLDFAKLHENILVMKILPECPSRKRASLIRHTGILFAAVITAAGKSGVLEASQLRKAIESLSVRTVELADANRQLALEIIKRKKVESALRKSEHDCLRSLEKSDFLKEQLRGLSRQILSVQEEERKRISRELHDVVAQALLGIHFRLATLKKEAGINNKGIDRNISQTQKLITKSANIVHQFARELRPAALDDLGLIPALQSFMKHFTTRTGVQTHLTFVEGIEKLNSAKRIVLYRVAQEALTNVARHAHASRVHVSLSKETNFAVMEVSDDGKSFKSGDMLPTGAIKRLGLLGMKERVEMVGGRFEIESSPGKGTKVITRIPFGKSIGSKLS